MLKNFYLLLIAALINSAGLKAEEATTKTSKDEVSSTEQAVSAEEAAIPAEKPVDKEPATEFPESELIEMVGLLTAQSGGVPMLKLDDAGVTAMAAGLVEGLTGTKQIEDYPEESIQESFGQAKARVEAMEAEAGQIPGISKDALQIIGFVMVMQSGLVELGFGAEEAPLIEKGFIAGATKAEPNPEDKAKLPAFQKFMQKRVAAAQAKAAAEAEVLKVERQAEAKAFFEELASDEAIQKSESGLYYKILEPGADEKPVLEDSVLVHYKGTLIDGTQFDSSYDRGEPATFPLNGVVAGFGEGLTKIGAGGKVTLYIPSELGYGDSPRPGGLIKPGDTLIFECELLEVNP